LLTLRSSDEGVSSPGPRGDCRGGGDRAGVRSLLVRWLVMIAFRIAKLPEAIYDRIRERAR
jgi:hypothetical protein